MGKKFESILRTFKQSPDANISLASAIAISYFTDLDLLAILPGAFALKQYYWGPKSYRKTKEYIQRYLERGEEVNEEAIKKVFEPCDYFGSRYAFREFKRNKLPTE